MPFQPLMRPVPLAEIQLTDRFWNRWQKLISDKSLPAQYEQLESTGRLENFRRCIRGESGGYQGIYFNDSDLYKWMEAAAYALGAHYNPKLREQLDEAVRLVTQTQLPDGYINTFFQLDHPDLKYRNLASMHELYCGGHLLEAGVALFENVGESEFLKVCIRYADHLVEQFGPGKKQGYCGHEEIELGLLKLFEVTKNETYRDLSLHMMEQRGDRPSVFERELEDEVAQHLQPYGKKMLSQPDGTYSGEYCQDHAPISEHKDVVGHAVRAMYLYAAAAKGAGLKPNSGWEAALETCWSTLVGKRMYITGGIGPSASNEGFTRDYDLPNLSAYAETCAACGLIFWGQAMLEQTGSSHYAEVIERALYNGAISGIGLDGTSYFYDNPLESRGNHERTPWFYCACCPPNLARLIGSLGRYVLGIAERDVWIHQFVGFVGTVTVGGVKVHLECESEFPWEGKLILKVTPEQPVSFTLRIRIPEWSDDVATDLPGAGEAEYEEGYAIFNKLWTSGDVLTVEMEMPPTWTEANPKVLDTAGRAAMTRGPLVYCAESVDNGFTPQLFTVDVEGDLALEWVETLGGITKITAPGFRLLEDEADELYSPFGTASETEAELQLIPYYAWANRGKSHMQVWLRS